MNNIMDKSKSAANSNKSRSNRNRVVIAPSKTLVSTPQVAVNLLKEFLANVDDTVAAYVVPRPKARWYSSAQIATWFLSNRNQYIHTGWLGRALHAAFYNGVRGTKMETIKIGPGQSLNVYR